VVKTKLSTSMTSTQFDNGYWYATELKDFAKRIGIPARRSLSTSGVRDVERGLSLDRRIVIYTNDKQAKDFLEREARRLAPGLKRKSGARYRLNRWREDRIAKGLDAPKNYRSWKRLRSSKGKP
jgi:hypothetical protein